MIVRQRLCRDWHPLESTIRHPGTGSPVSARLSQRLSPPLAALQDHTSFHSPHDEGKSGTRVSSDRAYFRGLGRSNRTAAAFKESSGDGNTIEARRFNIELALPHQRLDRSALCAFWTLARMTPRLTMHVLASNEATKKNPSCWAELHENI